MPHFLYTGASTRITLDGGKAVALAKNTTVELPADIEWVKRHVGLKLLTEVQKPKAAAKKQPAPRKEKA